MIHPHTRVQTVSDVIGVGVFATRLIPKGTVVYATDPLDVVLVPGHPLIDDPVLAENIDIYSYVDPDGSRVICWDHGKYVNHACTPSTLTTGYGFEIALRDIHPGEEITDDYGIFCTCFGPLLCGEPECRGNITTDDFDRMIPSWDQRIQDALRHFNEVEQPLMSLIDTPTQQDLMHYLNTGERYRSVAAARYGETMEQPSWVQKVRPKQRMA